MKKKKTFKKIKDHSTISFFKTLILSFILISIFAALPNSIFFVKKNFKSNMSKVEIGIDHKDYSHSTRLNDLTKKSLSADFN